jgi:hypothetical protein
MPTKIDLTNQKFNMLTVIEEVPHKKGEGIKWRCKCDCGNETIAIGSELRSGHKKSCGCLKYKIKNIQNQRFGKIIAIRPTLERDSSGSVIWECQCDCGKIFKTSAHKLSTGNTKSCGCERIKKLIEYNHTRMNNIQNQKFGLLTALYINGTNNNKSIIWHCKCDCGNECDVSNRDLLTGNTKSCGCQRNNSYGEQRIIQLLKENHISFESEKTFGTCRFLDTHALARFDFYVDNKYLIEFDGVQHIKEGKGVFDNPKKFTITQEHDRYKNQWCKDNNIPLIRIPYTQYNNLCIEDLLLETSKFII